VLLLERKWLKFAAAHGDLLKEKGEATAEFQIEIIMALVYSRRGSQIALR